MTDPNCSVCGGTLTPYATGTNGATYRCNGCGLLVDLPPQDLHEVATVIVSGGAYHHQDAVRVAQAYLEAGA